MRFVVEQGPIQRGALHARGVPADRLDWHGRGAAGGATSVPLSVVGTVSLWNADAPGMRRPVQSVR
jgi:hypothetical protein